MTFQTLSNNSIPRNLMMRGYEGEEQNWEFPVTLSDGQHVSVRIPQIVSNAISEEKENLIIIVFECKVDKSL